MGKHIKDLPQRIILWGGTGQAKVVRPIVEHYGSKVVAVFDDTPNLASPFPDVPIFFSWSGFKNWAETQNDIHEIGFCIAIGNPHGRVRLKLHEQLSNEGLKPITVIHPTACIAEDAEIGEGSQILAGAFIGIEAKIGMQCIVNCHAIIEHETVVEDAVEIGQNSTVLGLVHIGENTFVGASTTILARLRIGSDVTIGAGTIVSDNLRSNEKHFYFTDRPI